MRPRRHEPTRSTAAAIEARYQAGKTLQTLPDFEMFPYDYAAPDSVQAERRLQADQMWQKKEGSRTDRHGPSVPLDAQGRAMTDQIQSLLNRRDHRPMRCVN